MRKYLLTSGVLLAGPLALQAQNPNTTEYIANTIVTPQFFIAVIAGVLLALGFQFILTALSVAAGITAVGDLKENYVESKYSKDDDDDDDDDTSLGTMVTTGFGIWSVVTVGLSLFGATALAINLALISSTVISITLGLVIWATFFILLFYLESKLVNTLVGGLINTATAGLRASGEAVKSMFTTSPETKIANVAENTVDKIRKDLSASFDPNMVNDTIDEFFTKLDKTVPDYEKVKNDIKGIIEESDKRYEKVQQERTQEQGKQQKENSGGGSPGKWMAIQQVMTQAIDQASGGEGDAGDKSKLEQLKQLQKELKDAYGEGDTNEEKLEKIVAKFTPAEEEQVKQYVDKVKDILSKATPDDMNKGEGLETKLMDVFKNPSVEANKIASRLGEIDRDTIIRILASNTALDRQQIEKYADKAEQMLKKLTSSMDLSGGGSGSGSDADAGDLKIKLQKEIFKFINHTGKPDINFSMLTSFFQSKFDSSGSGDSLKSLKNKLMNADRDTIMNLVTSNTNIDQSNIDNVVNSIEEAKQNVLDKVQKIEDEANRRIENMKRKAVIQAEHARKNAAAAAWWLVISAVLSAGAAIGGSLVALG